MKNAVFMTVSVLFLLGCVSQNTEVKTPSFDQQLVRPQADYSNGSLWQAGSSSLTEDFKARRKGDIVTILISESASASKEAKTATSRSSDLKAGITNFMGLERQLKSLIGGDPANMVGANAESTYDGAGSTSRQERLTATVSAKVTDVLPNGNLLIEGRRNVKVNNEDQIIVIEGTVRPSDIGPSNMISSALIADARISYSGKGIISDRQSPGWLMNIVDKIWPF